MDGYHEYYLNQAGSGLAGFSGIRYQRGHGFFGKLFSGTLLPALKFLGRKALNTGVHVGQDLLEGRDLKESVKRRALESGRETANVALKRARKYVQKGKGKRKKKRLIHRKKKFII